MRTTHFVSMMAAALVLAAPGMAGSSPAAAQQAVPGVEGGWVGQFAQTDWTFELRRSVGGWSGRYMTASSGKWRDLQKVRVNGNAVRFSIVSQPPIVFDLSLDAKGQDMRGSVKISEGLLVPFSARRKP